MATDFSPLDVVQLDYGLRLVPRLKFTFSFFRADRSVKAVDEWSLKEAMKVFLKNSIKVSVTDSDLVLQREREPQKKKRDEPVASGLLFVWDIEGLLRQDTQWQDEDNIPGKAMERGKQFVAKKLQGVNLNVSGLKLRCEVLTEDEDAFEAVEGLSERIYGPRRNGFHSKDVTEGSYTLILKDVPSRWFAEPRVSSKASVLVTHTIFSKFGMIRNLEINGVDAGSSVRQENFFFPTSLQCQIWVQYETFSSFSLVMKAFCGRSMQKDGTSLKANYQLVLDKDGFFLAKNVRKRKFEKGKVQILSHQQLVHDACKAKIKICNQFEQPQQLVHEVSKADIFHNTESEQIGLLKPTAECSSGECNQKKAEEEKLKRQQEEIYFAQGNSRRRARDEQEKHGSQLDRLCAANMASMVVGSVETVHRKKKEEYAEPEQNLHKNEHHLQKSRQKITDVLQDSEYERDKALEMTNAVAERWVLECAVTEASLSTSNMLEQAAIRISLMQSSKGRHDDHEKTLDSGDPFYSSNKNSSLKTLHSKIVGNNLETSVD